MWPFWSCPRINTHTPGNMKFTILVEGFVVYTIMNSDFLRVCGSRDVDFLTVWTLCDHLARHRVKAYTLKDMKFTVLEGFLFYIIMNSVFSYRCVEVEIMILNTLGINTIWPYCPTLRPEALTLGRHLLRKIIKNLEVFNDFENFK